MRVCRCARARTCALRELPLSLSSADPFPSAAEGALPPSPPLLLTLISSSPPAPLPPSLSPPYGIQQRRYRHHSRYEPRRQRGKIRCERAPKRAQRAPPVIFLKDLSTRGKESAGSRGGGFSLRREGIPRTREAGRPPLLPPLENPSSLFCANSSTLGRGSPLEKLADA